MEIHSVEGTLEEQVSIEEECRDVGTLRYLEQVRKEIAEGRICSTPYGSLLIKLGMPLYVEKLKEYFKQPLVKHHVKQRNLLLLITEDVDVIAYEVLTSVLNSASSNNNSLTNVANAIMDKLFNNYVYGKIKTNNPKLYSYLGYEFKRATKRKRKELIDKNIKSLYDEYSQPESALKLQVGSMLIRLLELSGANIITIDKRVITYSPYKTGFTISFSPEAMEIMASIDGSDIARNFIERKPLIIPPKDWTSIRGGGYYTTKDRLVNYGNSAITRDFQNEQTYRDVLPIINKLQRTPWRVNARMLDIVEYVFTHDIPIGKLPSSKATTWKDYMTMPPYDPEHKEVWVEANKKRQQLQIELDAEFSKRLMLILALGTAKTMLKYSKFY